MSDLPECAECLNDAVAEVPTRFNFTVPLCAFHMPLHAACHLMGMDCVEAKAFEINIYGKVQDPFA